MRQWGSFVLGTWDQEALTRAAEVIEGQPALWRPLARPRLIAWPDRRRQLAALQLDGFSDGQDEWAWYAEHEELAGAMAKAAGARVWRVLCVDGGAYEEWVMAFDPDGRRTWELREGDDGPNLPRLYELSGKALAAAAAKTPFGRLTAELGVAVKEWLDVEEVEGALTVALREVVAKKPRRPPAGPSIRVTVEVPALVAPDVRRLAAAWTRAGPAVSALKTRAELFQRVPRLPIIGERASVEIRIGTNRWQEVEAEAARLNVDPGRLLAAAFMLG